MHAVQNSVFVPSASAPPSSGRPGLWRRKSGIGAVDAQGHLLSHPMASIFHSLGQPHEHAPDLPYNPDLAG